MATVTYSIESVLSEFVTNASTQFAGFDETQPVVLALADGGFAVAVDVTVAGSDTPTRVVDIYNADGSLRVGSTIVDDSSNTGGIPTDASMTQLTDGRLLITWTDNKVGVGFTPGIHYAILAPATGAILVADTLMPDTDSADFASNVVALAGGGWALVKEETFSASDQDADLLIFDSTGTQVGSTFQLDGNSGRDERDPAVTVLTGGVNNGNVVVAYEREIADGSGTFQIAIEIITPAGVTVLSPFAFDASGDQQLDPDIVALPDGGLAVVYDDNGYAQDGASIAFFDAAGALRPGGILRVDTGSFDERELSIGVLQNGLVYVTYNYDALVESDVAHALFDPVTLTRVLHHGYTEIQSGAQHQPSFTVLANGNIVTAWTDENSALEDGNTDPGDTHVSIQIDQMVRTTTGDGTDETLAGDSLRDIIDGGGGADILTGAGNNDVINGGADGDVINGGAGADALNGGTGNDAFAYEAADEPVSGETVDGGEDTDTLLVYYANAYDFTGTAITNVERLQYSGFAVTTTATLLGTHLGGLGKITTVQGSAGAVDVLIVTAAPNVDLSGVTFTGWVTGTDTITINGTVGANTLTGSAQNDTINGGDENDVIRGGAGADTIDAGAGNDTVFFEAGEGNLDSHNGGADTDTINGNGATFGLDATFNLTTGTYSVQLSPLEVWLNFENYTNTGAGVETVIGTSGVNVITTGSGSNMLIGNGGADQLNGGGGIDNMSGGDGDDTYFADVFNDIIFEANPDIGSGGNDLVNYSGTGTFTLSANVERLTLTNATANVNGTGNALANTLDGSQTAKANVLRGLQGNDTYIVRAGDTAVETIAGVAGGTDTVRSLVTHTLGLNVEHMVMLGAGNGTGNATGNSLDGSQSAFANQLRGLGGSDTYTIGANDTVFETIAGAAGGTDTVRALGNHVLGVNLERLVLISGGNQNGTGNTAANTITGNGFVNTLNGKGGNDVLTGGLGNDFFVFDTVPNGATNRDRIMDLNESGDDVIRLQNTGAGLFNALATGALAATAYTENMSGLATTAAQRIIYEIDTGMLRYDSNGSLAGGVIVHFATLDANKAALYSNADFLVI